MGGRITGVSLRFFVLVVVRWFSVERAQKMLFQISASRMTFVECVAQGRREEGHLRHCIHCRSPFSVIEKNEPIEFG